MTPDDIAAACAAAGKPVRLEIDTSKPKAARGPVDVEAAARDFGFRAQVGHREGIRRMIEAGWLTAPQRCCCAVRGAVIVASRAHRGDIPWI